MNTELKTLTDAIRYFSDEQVCIDTVAALRWPDGPACPACESLAPRQHWLKAQRRWQCRECGKQYSVKVNTIFEDSAIKLDKWLTAMWMLANCRNGVSSYEIGRSIGVTQKSAWFMLQRIRLAMKNQSLLKLGYQGGPVEMDETYIGGKLKNMHKNKKPKGPGVSGKAVSATAKTIVVGMLERKGRAHNACSPCRCEQAHPSRRNAHHRRMGRIQGNRPRARNHQPRRGIRSRVGSHQRNRKLLGIAETGIEWHLYQRRTIPP
jgi:transposase-like protein